MTAAARTYTLAVLLVMATSPARAQEACWAPDRSQPPDRAVARVAPLNGLTADIAGVSAILKRSRALLQLPAVRLMVSSYIGYANAGFGHAVRVSAGLYPPNTWQPGCTLIRGPEFFNTGHIHVTFNEPRAIFGDTAPRLRDEALTAYAAPGAGMPAGRETYYPLTRGVVLTPGGQPPWIPVTVGELLAFREREAQAASGRLRQQQADLQASEERYRADMSRQIAQAADPAQQAQLRAAMEQNTATLRAGAAAGLASLAPLLRDAEATLQRVRDERSRASAEALSAPAVVDGTGLVRLNPALADGGRRVNLVVVQAVANAKALQAPLEAAVRELDFAALRALLLPD